MCLCLQWQLHDPSVGQSPLGSRFHLHFLSTDSGEICSPIPLHATHLPQVQQRRRTPSVPASPWCSWRDEQDDLNLDPELRSGQRSARLYRMDSFQPALATFSQALVLAPHCYVARSYVAATSQLAQRVADFTQKSLVHPDGSSDLSPGAVIYHPGNAPLPST